MINLEEEARKRRERLKSALTGSASVETKNEEVSEMRKRKGQAEALEAEVVEEVNEFRVPEGEVFLDASGAEILSLDSK